MATRMMPCYGGVLAIAAMMLLVAGAGAQTRDCTLAYSLLTPCVSYVQGNDTTPTLQCCSSISSLNTNDPECLCQIVTQFNSSSSSGGFNATKAFALPSQCGVAVDSANCPALALAPGAAVAPTPAGSVAPPEGSAPPTSVAAPHADLSVAVTALLAATHLVWNALTAT